MKLLSLVGFFIVSHSMMGQFISGAITDAESGEPVPYAHVWYKGTSIGTYSSENGSFKLPTGDNAVISFSAIGYERTDRSISKNDKELVVKLNPSIVELESVEIAASGKWKEKKIGYTSSNPLSALVIVFWEFKKQHWKVSIENDKKEEGYVKNVHLGIKNHTPDSGNLIVEVFFTAGENEEKPLSMKPFIRKIDLSQVDKELIFDFQNDDIPLVPYINMYFTFIGIENDGGGSFKGGDLTIKFASKKSKKPFVTHRYSDDGLWKPYPPNNTTNYSLLNLWLEVDIKKE